MVRWMAATKAEVLVVMKAVRRVERRVVKMVASRADKMVDLTVAC